MFTTLRQRVFGTPAQQDTGNGTGFAATEQIETTPARLGGLSGETTHAGYRGAEPRAPSAPRSPVPNDAAAPIQKRIVIQRADDLLGLKYGFESVLDGVEIASHLQYCICPVLLGGQRGTPTAKVAIFCIDTYENSDEVQHLLTKFMGMQKASGWMLWTESPVIVCASHLLLSIVRKELTKERISRTRAVAQDKLSKGAFEGFNSVIQWGIANNASDITFEMNDRAEYSQVKFTIYGLYVAPEQFRMPTGTMLAMLRTAYSVREGGKDPVYDQTKEQDCRLTISIGGSDVLLRWGGIATHHPGPSVTLRIVTLGNSKIRTLEELDYLPTHRAGFRRVTNSEGGALIFVGVVNSGKTHAIAAVLAGLPATRKRMTLEDPVELVIPGTLQKSVAGEYEEALRLSKRSAMSDVLLGEVRNQKDGVAFQDLTAMGTNLYTTTHAPSIVAAFDKLAQQTIGIPRDFLGTPQMIKAVVAQALIAKNCEHCRKPFSSLLADSHPEHAQWTRYIRKVEALYSLADLDKRFHVRDENGCSHCRVSGIPELFGYSGRQLVAEMFEPDDHAYELIAKGDAVGLNQYIASQRVTGFDDANMDGKSAMECAVYHATNGKVDPRAIEPKFRSFDREYRLREARNKPTSIARAAIRAV